MGRLAGALGFRIGTEQHRLFADLLYQQGIGGGAQSLSRRQPLGTIGAGNLHFDQFVSDQVSLGFFDNAVGQTVLAYQYHWIKVVRTCFESGYVFIGQGFVAHN